MFIPIRDLGALSTNAYIVADEISGRGCLIDPAADEERIVNCISKSGTRIEKILLTHAHFDHIGAADFLRKQFGIPIMAHENSRRILASASINLSVWSDVPFTLGDVSVFKDREIISVGETIALRVIHTPGHTSDSVVFYDEKNRVAFTGDTIFKGDHGAVHFPTGDPEQMKQSLRRILSLPPDTILLPGHGEATTVAEERMNYC